MWGPESPNDSSSHCHSLAHPSSSTHTVQPDSLPPGSLQTPCSFSSNSLDSLSSQPNSLRAPPSSLSSVLDSTSIQTDSLDSLPGPGESLASFRLLQDSLNPCDSLESINLYCGSHLRSVFSLCDSLETSSIQRDSLQSVPSLCDSTQASSIPSDSLESSCSLCDSLETSVTQQHCSGSYSV